MGYCRLSRYEHRFPTNERNRKVGSCGHHDPNVYFRDSNIPTDCVTTIVGSLFDECFQMFITPEAHRFQEE